MRRQMRRIQHLAARETHFDHAETIEARAGNLDNDRYLQPLA